jgi:cold shock protein
MPFSPSGCDPAARLTAEIITANEKELNTRQLALDRVQTLDVLNGTVNWSARTGRSGGSPARSGLPNVDTEQKEENAMTGSIQTLRVEKGFGFIKDDAGKEYFFHRSAVYGEGLENLKEGDGVEFEIGAGPKGPRAENVRRTTT